MIQIHTWNSFSPSDAAKYVIKFRLYVCLLDYLQAAIDITLHLRMCPLIIVPPMALTELDHYDWLRSFPTFTGQKLEQGFVISSGQEM